MPLEYEDLCTLCYSLKHEKLIELLRLRQYAIVVVSFNSFN